MLDKIIRSLGITFLFIVYFLMLVGLIMAMTNYQKNIKEANVENHELKKENIKLREQVGMNK